mgnify:CR=1 FL=1
MQRCVTSAELREFFSFSILGRIGGDATDLETAKQIVVQELSVSSVGSEAMQLEWAQSYTYDLVSFQYPRSDRRRCNR